MDEMTRRLRDLRMDADGTGHKWERDAAAAREHVRPNTRFDEAARSASRLDAGAIQGMLLPEDAARQAELRRLLRAHWVEPVHEPDELRLRASFDAALTSLQLIELGIETGYLDLMPGLQSDLRKEILDLLWSDAARTFLDDYDYLAVRFLGERVGVSLGSPIDPPSPVNGGEIRFAQFFAGYLRWEGDEALREWLDLLDGYQVIEDEKKRFRSFVDDNTRPTDERVAHRFATLLEGVQKFIVYLADLVGGLDDEAQEARFGTVFAFWMAKFFGEEWTGTEYVTDAARDWSAPVRSSPVLRGRGGVAAAEGTIEVLEHQHEQLTAALDQVVGTWRVTRRLLESTA